MISTRVARQITIVNSVTIRIELSQIVWYSSLSERAFGIFREPPCCDKGRILGEAVSEDFPPESQTRGDPHVRFRGSG